MTITYHVEAEAELVLTTGKGVLTDSDLHSYVKAVLSNSEVRPGFNELIDLRAVTRVQLSDPEIDTTIQAILESEQQIKETNTAMVASDGNTDEISRLYEILQTSVPATVRFFGDLSEARAWLGLSQEQGRGGAPRKAASHRVRIRTGIHDLSAQLIDISRSGALLQCATFQPPKGRSLKIQIQRQGGANVDLTGTVVRVTQNTFAIQFVSVPDELADLMRKLGMRVHRTTAGLP